MKPLELTVYPRVDDSPSWPEYRSWFRDRMAERDAAEAKHLTDAELAAEWQRMAHEFDIAKYGLEAGPFVGRTRDYEDAGDRVATLHRFAITPHYSEEAA